MLHAKTIKKRITLYGKHPCISALLNPRRICYELFVTKSSHEENKDLIEKVSNSRTIKIHEIESEKFNSILAKNSLHQGFALTVEPLESDLSSLLNEAANQKFSTLVILDQVVDPHNVGAVLRSAAAFDAKAVILTERNSPTENATIAKTSTGAVEVIPLVYVVNLVDTIKTLKANNYWCYGLDSKNNTPINKCSFHEKTALILGSEERGLRRLTKQHCDFLITIPMSENIESLNVSNAASIALHTIYSRKNQ